MKHRIVLDTDMGGDVDDALGLCLALAAPDIEVVAVTHVSQDTAIRAQISKRLLELAGHGDVPVYAGSREALSGGDAFLWLGHEGKGILDPQAPPPPVEREEAVQALLRLFAADGPLELVAVGPLTNLARALQRDPSMAGRIARLTVMGGHLRRVAYGGVEFPAGVDYNLCSDPPASLRVLHAGIPTRLVTADVTLQTWLRQEDLRAIEAAGTPLHRALAAAVRQWTPLMSSIFSGMGAAMDGDNVAFLHDPLAMACVYDESFCRFEDLSVEAVVVDGVFRTIERPPGSSGTAPMRCATSVDAERFRAHFLERILSLGR